MPLLVLLLSFARAGELDDLLARGEVSLTETRADGHLSQVTTISDVAAPRSEVWNRLVDFAGYKSWMPQVARSDVVATTPGAAGTRQGEVIDVAWGIKVPGPNVDFVARYTLYPAKWTIRGEWVSGALAASHWEWRLVERAGGGTRVYRTCYTNVVGDNWLIRQFDDDWHTLEYGINAATGVIELKGLKRAMGAR